MSKGRVIAVLMYEPGRLQCQAHMAAHHTLLVQAAVAIAMVGATYGAVPLYRLFCQATGYGGTVQEGATVEAKLKARQEAKDEELEAACAARELTVFFNADVNDNLPWKFTPTQRSVKVCAVCASQL